MKIRSLIVIASASLALQGCSVFDRFLCEPNCHAEAHNSSSLVGFLYPNGKVPPPEDMIPELHVPLRVGLAFLPSQTGGRLELNAAQREELMGRIRQRFADRKFIAEITEIPDYYLKTTRGFEGLQGVQRLYNVDVMALVSYDQVAHLDDNDWSLGYLTIVGAFVLKGSHHDLATLVDLAVIDPTTRSLILRAGGTDMRRHNTTLIDQERDSRTMSAESFAAATNQMINNFDAALTRFETDVREHKARVRVVSRNNGGGSHGGGAIDAAWFAVLLGIALLQTARRKLLR